MNDVQTAASPNNPMHTKHTHVRNCRYENLAVYRSEDASVHYNTLQAVRLRSTSKNPPSRRAKNFLAAKNFRAKTFL